MGSKNSNNTFISMPHWGDIPVYAWHLLQPHHATVRREWAYMWFLRAVEWDPDIQSADRYFNARTALNVTQCLTTDGSKWEFWVEGGIQNLNKFLPTGHLTVVKLWLEILFSPVHQFAFLFVISIILVSVCFFTVNVHNHNFSVTLVINSVCHPVELSYKL
jgi:hypothetical protein